MIILKNNIIQFFLSQPSWESSEVVTVNDGHPCYHLHCFFLEAFFLFNVIGFSQLYTGYKQQREDSSRSFYVLTYL